MHYIASVEKPGLIIYLDKSILCAAVESCETIHPGTKEGSLQKGQEPNLTHRRSEGPFHNLQKTRGNNIELHQCLTFWSRNYFF